MTDPQITPSKLVPRPGYEWTNEDIDVADLRALLNGPLTNAPDGSGAAEPPRWRGCAVGCESADRCEMPGSCQAPDGTWLVIDGGRWISRVEGDLSAAELVTRGATLTHLPVPVATLTALLDAAEQWEQPSAAGWKRARLERDALRKDRDRLRRAIVDFLSTYTLHVDITRGLTAAVTSSGETSDG